MAGEASSTAAAVAALSPETSRSECSLCILTTDFLRYMAAQGTNSVDLKLAATELQTHKRRIYDVTNVLEGVGLISKSGPNNVTWRGDATAPNLDNTRFRAIHQERLRQLTEIQQRMAAASESMQRCIRLLTSSQANQDMLFVTRRDLTRLETTPGHQLMAIKAPPGSTMAIPNPRVTAIDGSCDLKFQAIVGSSGEPLKVWLITGEEADVNLSYLGSADGPSRDCADSKGSLDRRVAHFSEEPTFSDTDDQFAMNIRPRSGQQRPGSAETVNNSESSSPVPENTMLGGFSDADFLLGTP